MVFVIYFAIVSAFVGGFTFYCKKIKAWHFSKGIAVIPGLVPPSMEPHALGSPTNHWTSGNVFSIYTEMLWSGDGAPEHLLVNKGAVDVGALKRKEG